VRTELVRAAARLTIPTLALGFVLAFKPGHAGLALRVYFLLLAAYALLVAVAALRVELPPATPLRIRARRSPRQHPPETLDRLEQEVVLGISGSFELHYHLAQRLRSLARDLLGGRRGISLDGDRDAARSALGDEAWELVRPDRAPPADRLARGIPPADLARIVTALEGI
jgi:hypothetical protein